MSDTISEGIRVVVRPAYWPERSSPESGQYAFTYAVQIANEGTQTARLRTRHWIITDASGKQEEVRGEGVVGEQPTLAPGERFEYTSGVPLSTASGFMAGRYQMVSETGERFEIDVPTFSLDSPDGKRMPN